MKISVKFLHLLFLYVTLFASYNACAAANVDTFTALYHSTQYHSISAILDYSIDSSNNINIQSLVYRDTSSNIIVSDNNPEFFFYPNSAAFLTNYYGYGAFGNTTNFSFSVYDDGFDVHPEIFNFSLIVPDWQALKDLFGESTIQPWDTQSDFELLSISESTIDSAPVPEPETYTMFAVGLLGLGLARKKAVQA